VVLAAAALACTGGSRLSGQIPAEDAISADTANVAADSHGEIAVDTTPPVSCLDADIACGDQAYCSYPDGLCRAPVPDCSDGWCVLPAAAFMMGDDGDRGPSWPWEQPRHPVILTHRIRMMATEITASAWEQAMGPLTNAAQPECGEDCPATGGTSTAKLAYANALSERDGLEPCYDLEGCTGTGDELVCEQVTYKGLICRGYRLPTEAESEFASRAAKDYCFDPTAPGADGDRDAWTRCDGPPIPAIWDAEWYCGNSDVDYPSPYDCNDPGTGRHCGYHPVGLKRPNAFGLYDILGNAPELTTTIWSDGTPDAEIDPGHSPTLPAGASLVFHVASFSVTAMGCCPTLRSHFPTAHAEPGGYTGFRLVQTLFDPE
jgi:formylglycine-generating enzyme required for sulfatase activity